VCLGWVGEGGNDTLGWWVKHDFKPCQGHRVALRGTQGHWHRRSKYMARRLVGRPLQSSSVSCSEGREDA
jgi:hypothetical protein